MCVQAAAAVRLPAILSDGMVIQYCVLRILKEKGEPRGENDHGAFPLVSLGQRSAAGALTIRASREVSWNDCF